MKYLAILFIFFSQPCFSVNQKRSIIEDPSFSTKCAVLLDERTKKIDLKNRILGLIDRNRRLRKITPGEKQSIVNKLETNFTELRRELYLTRQKILNSDEEIVRKGCPGITI
ncbi:MAG: hypothetical protein ACO20H_04665 [Bacteriovoracaceae bacterium]